MNVPEIILFNDHLRKYILFLLLKIYFLWFDTYQNTIIALYLKTAVKNYDI